MPYSLVVALALISRVSHSSYGKVTGWLQFQLDSALVLRHSRCTLALVCSLDSSQTVLPIVSLGQNVWVVCIFSFTLTRPYSLAYRRFNAQFQHSNQMSSSCALIFVFNAIFRVLELFLERSLHPCRPCFTVTGLWSFDNPSKSVQMIPSIV